MTPAERRVLIDSYGRAAAELEAALAELPAALWTWRPAPDQWTVHEIVLHITDSEANSYVRARRFIAEPGRGLMGYDERAWAERLHYHALPPAEAVELFRSLRRSTYRLIQTLPEIAWAHTAVHSESGLMTLDDWLVIYERHVRDHVAQMQAVRAAWEQAGRPAA